MVDEVLQWLSPQFDRMYGKEGRRSIPAEKLPRAQLRQLRYSIRSERLLMEEIDYSILLRWFVGLKLDEEVRDGHGVYQKSGPAAAGRRGQAISRPSRGAGSGPTLDLGRTLHGGWEAARSLGWGEELSAPGPKKSTLPG